VSVEERPKVSFEELAGRYRHNQHKQARRRKLEQHLHATKVSIGVSARLLRLGAAVQRGLVDRLKHDDKANFIALYHTMVDLQEPCSLMAQRHLCQPDDSEDWPSSRESTFDRAPDFFCQLSPQSQADLLDILQSVRTDPQFVFEKLCSLTPIQLSALISSSVSSWEVGGDSFPASSRSRIPSLSSKTVPASGIPFKDRVLAFERTDPLSTLLFNVYAASLDSDAPEAQLRLDMWSSVCAKLIADGANRSYALIDHILTLWATGSDWKAKPKFELYLMDILQTGAFLLEHIEPPPGYDMDPIDPLRTEVAEEYFASTVDALLELLDDPDAGLPWSIVQLGKAIMQKLDRQDCRDRFLDFLFGQWFFPKFLYGALTYPEVSAISNIPIGIC
jgi:chromatin assembly factor 1 subunit A